MQGSISFGGKVAKWAPGKGWVVTVQTERLLRPAAGLPTGSPREARPATSSFW